MYRTDVCGSANYRRCESRLFQFSTKLRSAISESFIGDKEGASFVTGSVHSVHSRDGSRIQ